MLPTTQRVFLVIGCAIPGQISRVGRDWCGFHQSANITDPADGQNFFWQIDQKRSISPYDSKSFFGHWMCHTLVKFLE